MTAADARHSETSASEPPVPPRVGRAAPRSPRVASAWLLRTSAFAAALAGIVGVLVAPGVRGNTGEPTVIVVDWASATLDAFLMGALMALWLDATLELMRTHEIPVAVRIALSGGGAATAALAAMALLEHEHPPAALSLLIASAASVVALAGATSAITAPHTRAVAGVLLAFAFASIARLAAWEMATHAGETANLALFGWSRVFATVGVMLEACGQMIAVVWLSSRGRWAGQLGLSLALFGAVGLTYAVAQGMHSGAALWQAIIHSSLADAPGIPRPYRLDAFAILFRRPFSWLWWPRLSPTRSRRSSPRWRWRSSREAHSTLRCVLYARSWRRSGPPWRLWMDGRCGAR